MSLREVSTSGSYFNYVLSPSVKKSVVGSIRDRGIDNEVGLEEEEEACYRYDMWRVADDDGRESAVMS